MARLSARISMNYGKRQERAEAIVKRFSKLATVEQGNFKGRTWLECVEEVEQKTDFGRDCVYWSAPLLRALAKGPPEK